MGFRPSLRLQIVLLVTGVLAVCLAIVAAFASYWVGAAAEEFVAHNALALAETLAISGDVKDALVSAAPEATLQPLAEKVRQASNVEFIVFLNMNGIRYSHPNASLVGLHFTGNDEGPALRGKRYVSKAEGISGPSLRAFEPIYDEKGTQIGVVVVGIFISTLQSVVSDLRTPLFYAALLSLGLGGLAAAAVAWRLKRTLLGLEPREIATLLQQRETIMASVREGIIAVDALGKVTLVNAEARRLLGCDESVVGQPVKDVVPGSVLMRVVESGVPELDQHFSLPDGRSLLANRLPLRVDGQVVGAVATVRDKSEVTRMAEQLTGVQRFVDGLRAQAHEFANRLQAIRGLIQIGAYDDVIQFTNAAARTGEAKFRQVSSLVRDPAVAGLLLGKMSESREHGTEIELAVDSYLPPLTGRFDPGAAVTTLGNLIDNAVEAGSTKIQVRFQVQAGYLRISVTDDGTGVPSAARPTLFERGRTTKGKSRGYGLTNVREAVQAAGGEVRLIPSERGSTFELQVPWEGSE